MPAADCPTCGSAAGWISAWLRIASSSSSRATTTILFQPRVDHSLVVELGSKAFGVDGWEGVDAIHASPSVAATDDCDELAGLLVAVGRDELDQRLLGDPPLRKGDDVLSVASPLVLAHGLAESDLDGAFGARRANEHAVGLVDRARSATGMTRPRAPARAATPAGPGGLRRCG